MSVPILRTSERRAFKRCARRWWWAYREGYRPIGAEKTPLWFGTITHEALAYWYIPGRKRGAHPAQTFERLAGEAMRTVKVVTETDEETVTSWEEAAKLGVVLLDEYVKHWGNDESWDFIQAEQTFSLPVPWPSERQQLYVVDEQTGLLCEYKGTYDGVYRDLVDGRIKLLETKTARSIQTGHLTLDDQAGSYWAVASRTLQSMGKIGPKESIAGINYNFLRKALPDTRPVDAEGYATNKPVKKDYGIRLGLIKEDATPAECRSLPTIEKMEEIAKSRGIVVLGERSKVQPQPLFHREMVHRTGAERRSQLLAIQDEAVHMQAMRDGMLPVTRNPTYDCHRDCDFFAPCELKERGGDEKALLKIAYRREDPYKDHRKSTDE